MSNKNWKGLIAFLLLLILVKAFFIEPANDDHLSPYCKEILKQAEDAGGTYQYIFDGRADSPKARRRRD